VEFCAKIHIIFRFAKHFPQKVHNKAIFVSFLTINDGFLLLWCKSTKIIAHNSHNYPKKFGSLRICAYFCSRKV